MYQTIRDSVSTFQAGTSSRQFIGQLVYFASGRRVLRHPEELPGFELPEKYRRSEKPQRNELSHRDSDSSERTAVEDRNIVSWYGADDPENPQNWCVNCDRAAQVRSLLKKCWITTMIMLITSSIYMGSSIWSPGVKQGVEYFGLGQVTVTLGISLFVVG